MRRQVRHTSARDLSQGQAVVRKCRRPKLNAGCRIIAFADLAAWEAWLAAQPVGATGLWLKLAKTGNADPSLTKAQAIDGALCHGWIDGRIDRYDDAWSLTRFTPRSPRSTWSQKSRKRAEELIAEQRQPLRDPVSGGRKKNATREARIAKFVAMCAAGETLH